MSTKIKCWSCKKIFDVPKKDTVSFASNYGVVKLVSYTCPHCGVPLEENGYNRELRYE